MPRGEEERQEVDLEMSEESAEPSEEEFELEPENHLQSLLQQESEKSKEFLDQLRRLQAEFENYRKRIDSRFEEAARFAGEGILLKVVDVRDNIKRALEVDFSKDPDSAKMGIEAILKQMDKLLSSEDVRPIESLGKIFDPYYQHAVHTKHEPEKPDGLIMEEYQEGFMYKEKVLRPAVVCVNRHVDSSAAEDEENPQDNDKGEQE
jgi:molecular chaperone GrpE